MKKIGLNEIKETDCMDAWRDTIKGDLRRLHESERKLTQKSYQKKGSFSFGVVLKFFRTWNEAIAGIGVHNRDSDSVKEGNGKKKGKNPVVSCGGMNRRVEIIEDKLECEYMKKVLLLGSPDARICSIIDDVCPNTYNVEQCKLLKEWRKKGVDPSYHIGNLDSVPITSAGTIV